MEWVVPMEPITSNTIPTGRDWIYQIKWDGIRGLIYYQRGLDKQIRIFTKNKRERTDFYPELHLIEDMIAGDSAVLDGELVVLGEDSKPSFQLSLIRERIGNPDKLPYYIKNLQVIYIVFDILYYQGNKLTNQSLKERQEILHSCLRPDYNIMLADNYTDGHGLFKLMKKKDWEGIVSKRLSSPYYPAKNHKEWYKHKTIKKMLAVVCGVHWKSGFPNSLILGIRQEDKWVYIGKASSGLTQVDLQQLKEYALNAKEEVCPFLESEMWRKQHVIWLNPSLTCWVRFLEWTNDGVLRHPTILGFSDIPAEQASGKELSLDE